MICHHCNSEIPVTGVGHLYHLEVGNDVYFIENDFCSRRCLIEFLAPELKQAVVVKQWIPTPEDEERMHQ